MVIKTTLKDYRTEQARLSMSADKVLNNLSGGNERLRTHSWTEEELQAIPEDMVQFAFEHSDALQREFGDITTFMAYRRAHGAGRARIAGVRR